MGIALKLNVVADTLMSSGKFVLNRPVGRTKRIASRLSRCGYGMGSRNIKHICRPPF